MRHFTNFAILAECAKQECDSDIAVHNACYTFTFFESVQKGPSLVLLILMLMLMLFGFTLTIVHKSSELTKFRELVWVINFGVVNKL